MTDIASLGVEVDTSDAGRGARDLDAFTAAGQRAQKQMDGLRTAADGTSRAQAEANSVASRAAAALGERTNSSESLLRAELALARALQARAAADYRIISSTEGVAEAELAAARAIAVRAREQLDAARIAVLEFTAMERSAAAQQSASAAAAELSSRYDLLSSKFTEGYREARQMDAALEDLAEAERLGVVVTAGASQAIDQIILKYDARARAAAQLRAELDQLRASEALAASAADGQARFGPGAGSGKSAQESAILFSQMMDEELAASSSSAQSYYNRLLGVQDEVESSARQSASAFEEEARRMEDLNRSAARLRSTIDPLGTAQDRYNREIREYNQLAREGVISASELGKAHAVAASRLQNYQAVMHGGMEHTAMGRQANLSNIVAQFQDIGVTAQMGMSPLTIAIQQGSQLTQALTQMENPLKGIGEGLLALISPLSLLTVGLVGLAALGLQLVDWATVAAFVLTTLADAMEGAAPYAVGLGLALALIYSPAIIGGIVQIVAWISRMGVVSMIAGAQMAAAWIMANPVTAILAGIALVITGIVLFRDQITQIFGRDIVGDIQNAANYIIGSFVGAFNGIRDVWGDLPKVFGDLVISAANVALTGLTYMINESKKMLIGYYKSVSNMMIPGVSQMSGLAAAGLDMIPDATAPQFSNPFAGSAGEAGNTIGDAMKAAQSYDYVGAAITGVQHAASGAADAIRGFAGTLDDDKPSKKAAAAAERLRKAYADIILDGQQFIASEALKAQSLGMTAEETNRLKYEQEMLNKAVEKGIILSPAQRAEIAGLATDMAATEEATRRLTDIYNFGKSTFASFFGDLRQGIMDGKGLWESLGDAAVNALDSIASKALEMAANGIFDMIFSAFASGFGGGGGFLGNDIGGSFNFGDLLTFEGGGYTGGGSRSGGMDGKGGFMAMLHPQETVTDHAGSGQNGGAILQVIDQRSSGTVRKETATGPNGEKIARAIIRDEVQQAARRGATGF